MKHASQVSLGEIIPYEDLPNNLRANVRCQNLEYEKHAYIRQLLKYRAISLMEKINHSFMFASIVRNSSWISRLERDTEYHDTILIANLTNCTHDGELIYYMVE